MAGERKWYASTRTWIAAVGASAVLAVAVIGWILVPNLYGGVLTESARVQAIVTTRASVLAALAGLGALVTISINYRNSHINAQALATTQETFRITERGHLTERYTRAIEQLGSERDAVRLGGIYSLEQLAVDSTRNGDQATVVEVLSAFVRVHRPLGHSAADDEAARLGLERAEESESLDVESKSMGRSGPDTALSDAFPIDVQAAVTVLGRLPTRLEVPRADLTGANLSNADLSDATLAGATIVGADLTRAKLTGADLRGADLSQANLTEATLNGVNLVAANLTLATLDSADLTNANLTCATLASARLFEAVLFSTDFSGAILSDSVLTAANLTGATLTAARLVDADVADATLTGSILRDAQCARADFAYARLRTATLTGANLTGAVLTGARLTGANLTGAILAGAHLNGADLTSTDLADADFSGADLTSAKLSGANLSRTDTACSIGLEIEESPRPLP